VLQIRGVVSDAALVSYVFKIAAYGFNAALSAASNAVLHCCRSVAHPRALRWCSSHMQQGSLPMAPMLCCLPLQMLFCLAAADPWRVQWRGAGLLFIHRLRLRGMLS
jgi:hypothetical protein